MPLFQAVSRSRTTPISHRLMDSRNSPSSMPLARLNRTSAMQSSFRVCFPHSISRIYSFNQSDNSRLVSMDTLLNVFGPQFSSNAAENVLVRNNPRACLTLGQWWVAKSNSSIEYSFASVCQILSNLFRCSHFCSAQQHSLASCLNPEICVCLNAAHVEQHVFPLVSSIATISITTSVGTVPFSSAHYICRQLAVFMKASWSLLLHLCGSFAAI